MPYTPQLDLPPDFLMVNEIFPNTKPYFSDADTAMLNIATRQTVLNFSSTDVVFSNKANTSIFRMADKIEQKFIDIYLNQSSTSNGTATSFLGRNDFGVLSSTLARTAIGTYDMTFTNLAGIPSYQIPGQRFFIINNTDDGVAGWVTVKSKLVSSPNSTNVLKVETYQKTGSAKADSILTNQPIRLIAFKTF